ncbi:ABC transporter permease [Faecalimonas umbilicata]|jgi:putative ABC transport system permease protein|uniref:ABC transporter permease n=1 Tax=Faecalimonas umbilicata TaxID=1912855 RepID=UPI000E3FC3DA|nr:FtsX-like permease family protein [Faecalimonas umbilicata]RGC79355.1 ABC transporter permease [Lachnospiraceae bacterium AM25-17]RJU68571.1 ABC transporter permease [Coprococcus sp. AM27-12LB]
MLKNNNQAVVKRLAKNNLKSNRRRSLSMVLAIMLSSFLLFSVFTVGATYLKMQRQQNIRLNGAEFDAIMYGISEEQKEILEENPTVEHYGVVMVSGVVAETEADKTPGVGLLYADDTYWKKMMAPARKFVKGHYPVEENEVMVTEDALKKCGFSDKKIGDEITFVYEINEKREAKTFRISGIWDGYGDTDNFYMSKAFCDKQKLDAVYYGRCHISFCKKWMSDEAQQAFIDSMKLKKSQRLFYVYEYGNATEIFLGLSGIALVTVLSAYLLIYNIMYLSVAGNIRYYGLLQTIGMTGRQIRQLMQKQLLWIGGIGMLAGILIGAGTSFFLIPVVVKTFVSGKEMGAVQVTFHPVIVLLTVLLTGCTVWYAGRKPTKIAVGSSPVEALEYRVVSSVRKRHKTRKGSLIVRMALEQLTRNKKKTMVTMLSLAASLSVFLCLITLLHTQSAREYSYNYMGLDMVLKNDTINNMVLNRAAEGEEQIQGVHPILNEELLNEIRQTDGVEEVLPTITVPTIVPWEKEVTDVWMREFYETWMNIPYEDDIEEYQQHPENFGSSLVGITEEDFRALNAEMEQPVDEEAFLSGKTCILYRHGLFGLDEKELRGKQISCEEYVHPENTRTFEIAGMTDVGDYVSLLGFPPTMIVIDDAVKAFTEKPIVFRVGIRYAEEYHKETEDAILSNIEESPNKTDFSWDSKIEQAENVKAAQGHMMEIGFGIVLILGIIGVMNYINTSVGNMQSRQKEISIMESVGMTERQVKKMLVWEGIFYTGGVLFLTLTVGIGITYAIYQTMNYMGAKFWFPALPFLGATLILFVVCIVVPVWTYQKIEKSGSLVERIRVSVE